MYDPNGYIEEIKRTIDYVSSTGNSSHAVIVGPYGSGKTHILKFLLKTLRKDRRFHVVYLQTPGTNFLTLYGRIIDSFIQDNFARFLEFLPSYISEKVKPILNSESQVFVYSWLRGEKVSSKMRNKLGLGSNLSEYDAISILSSLISQLDKVCVVLVDEFEAIVDSSINVRQRYLSHIRQLIDQAYKNLSLIIAVTPAGWTEIVENHFALARRLSGSVIFLESLTLKQAYELVDLYIQDHASKPKRIFSREVIKEAYVISQGNIGEFLKLMAVLVDYAAKKKARKINLDLAKEVLGRYA